MTTPTPDPVLICCAVEMEANAMRRALAGLSAVDVITIGIGAHSCPADAAARAKIIILAGLGGALDPSLSSGDLVIDDRSPIPPVSLAHRCGRIHTSASIVSTPDEKARSFARTQALVVDMEDAPLRSLCAKAGTPFISIRAISDTARESLDPDVLRIVDSKGRVKFLSLCAAVATRPSLLAKLIHLSKNSKVALTNLGQAVREIIVSIRSGVPAPTRSAE